jgi:N-acyl-D-aspartate/D-glutamate deacylase
MWGLHDRALGPERHAADRVVVDEGTSGARRPGVVQDLPAGAKRLKQTANGIRHTVVTGEVLLTDNVHEGASPGRLLRV